MLQFIENRACVQVNGKWGFVDRSGSYIVEPVYEQVTLFHLGMSRVKLNGKFGYVDINGHRMIPPIYDQVIRTKSGYTNTKMNGFIGLICTKDGCIMNLKSYR